MSFKRSLKQNNPISEVIISLLSPEAILKESSGEITRPETKNHRTYKPVRAGLFCECIYGPEKDWECLCGKYKGIRYKYTICDQCGVEINERKVRRERIGHIKLAVDILHPWFLKNRQANTLLGIPFTTFKDINSEKLYIVVQEGTDPPHQGDTQLTKGTILTEAEYNALKDTLPIANETLADENPDKFIVQTGGKAIRMLLERLNLNELARDLRNQIANATSKLKKADFIKRLQIVEAFRNPHKKVENRPEWMVLRILPVISPELRPLILLNGHFSMSDITELYKNLIARNNRVRKFTEELKAPELVLRSERRLLQEALYDLLDADSKTSTGDSTRPLKSLSEMLKGKQGRFRQNLLGKRLDYSGRAVIIPGPELKLHECGLPKEIAVELYKWFIINRLLVRGRAETVKDAKNLIERKDPVVWEVLQYVVKDHPVLLNRAPTLHRLGIQAFIPKLIEGKAIQLHPLVCAGFNADFDGDQMAVHLPLSSEAQAEALEIMLSSKNLLNSINGRPIVLPSKDMVLGLYWLTKGKKSTAQEPIQGEGMTFYDIEEVIIAINNNKLSYHAHIKLLINHTPSTANTTKIINTTSGRALFNKYVPKELGYINELLTKQKIEQIVFQSYKKTNQERTAQFLDDLKELGFKYCFESGISINIDDIKIPESKPQILKQAHEEVDAIQENYLMGIITNTERYNQTIDIWTKANMDLTEDLIHDLKEDQQGFNNIYMMMDSGARGSREQVRQLGGMRGLMLKTQKNINDPTGGINEYPIEASLKEGIDIVSYFPSVCASRGVLADTSMKTGEAGHVSRKLDNVAQGLCIKEYDCGTHRGLTLNTVYDNEGIVKSLAEQIQGRVPVENITHPTTGQILVHANQYITEEQSLKLQEQGIKSLRIRSVVTCESKEGICTLCYGIDLSKQAMVQQGQPIGFIAAQGLGEPGTQLTMRTFHKGGASQATVVENKVKSSLEGIVRFDNLHIATLNKNGKTTNVVLSKTGEVQILDPQTKQELITYHIPYGSHLLVSENQKIDKSQEICYWDSYNTVILAKEAGKVTFANVEEDVTYKKEYDEQTGYYDHIIIESRDKNKNPSIILQGQGTESIYNLPVGAHLIVKEGQEVQAGETLVKISRIIRKIQDITGGLPRVTELFEARNPSNAAILAPIEGIVHYGKIKRGSREITIVAKDNTKVKILIPLSKYILIQDQEYVKHSTIISDGVLNIANILAIQGPEAVQKYIIDEVQTIYRMQGVNIDSKHIEVIVRQMMQKLEIVSSGDTTFIPTQLVDKKKFHAENQSIQRKRIITSAPANSTYQPGDLITINALALENEKLERNGEQPIIVRKTQPAIAKLKIQGITRATINSESFLSAAGFQETTKVLASAAIRGRVDELKTIKANMIVGNLMPAGTGLPEYQNMLVTPEKEYKNLLKQQEQTK